MLALPTELLEWERRERNWVCLCVLSHTIDIHTLRRTRRDIAMSPFRITAGFLPVCLIVAVFCDAETVA